MCLKLSSPTEQYLRREHLMHDRQCLLVNHGLLDFREAEIFGNTKWSSVFLIFSWVCQIISKCLKLSRPWLVSVSNVFRTWFSKAWSVEFWDCWMSINHVLTDIGGRWGFKNQWSTPWSTFGLLMEYFWSTFRVLLEDFEKSVSHASCCELWVASHCKLLQVTASYFLPACVTIALSLPANYSANPS